MAGSADHIFWDAFFRFMLTLLESAANDAGKLAELTARLKASTDSLAQAVAANQPLTATKE